MSTSSLRSPLGLAAGRSRDLAWTTRDILLISVAGVGALAISILVPQPNFIVTGVAIVIALGTLAFVVCARLEVTLTLLGLYLGLVDGPIKLLTASQATSALRDVLIGAICVGLLVRLVVSEDRVRLPPLAGWVLAFIAFVVAEAANPGTYGVLNILGGYRQQLEWVPFFFFAYLVMRSTTRFRKLFIVLGVIALANGVIGAYQSHLSPDQLASWGPGYNNRVHGIGVSDRTYVSEGVAHPRALGLGSDSGFGGGVGVTALPGLLALLMTGAVRRRWTALFLIGSLLGIATAASKTSTIIGLAAVLSFIGLSLLAGVRVGKLMAGLLAMVVLIFAVASVVVSFDGSSIFKRQEHLSFGTATNEEEGKGGAKLKTAGQIPNDLAHAPFGLALGSFSAASGFGEGPRPTIEGEDRSAESAYNLLALELGAPGLLLWVGLTINVIAFAALRIRRIADLELRTYLAAVFAVFLAFTLQGFSTATLSVSPAGTFLWFAIGIAAYWLAPRRRRARLTPAQGG